MKIDLADILVCLGLVTATVGLWLISPSWALIVAGSVVFGLGIVGSRGGR